MLLVTFAALGWGQVRHETVVVVAGDQHGWTLIADLCIHGVWLTQAETLFDIRVLILMPSHICAILLVEFAKF